MRPSSDSLRCSCFASASLLPPDQVAPFFFFNDTATTEIYTLSLHDALPISAAEREPAARRRPSEVTEPEVLAALRAHGWRSEEHTSELQSPDHLLCRLPLEKKTPSKHTRLLSCRLP